MFLLHTVFSFSGLQSNNIVPMSWHKSKPKSMSFHSTLWPPQAMHKWKNPSKTHCQHCLLGKTTSSKHWRRNNFDEYQELTIHRHGLSSIVPLISVSNSLKQLAYASAHDQELLSPNDGAKPHRKPHHLGRKISWRRPKRDVPKQRWEIWGTNTYMEGPNCGFPPSKCAILIRKTASIWRHKPPAAL